MRDSCDVTILSLADRGEAVDVCEVIENREISSSYILCAHRRLASLVGAGGAGSGLAR